MVEPKRQMCYGISKLGSGIYNWYLDDERKRLWWISDANVNEVLMYSRALWRKVLNI